MEIGSHVKHEELGIGEVLYARDGFPAIRALFTTGEHKAKRENLKPYELILENHPIEGFQGDTRWLSNFEESEITLEGITFPTVEHAYQAAKTLIPAERERVRACSTPGKARRAGNKVSLRFDWESVKVGIMMICTLQKFSRHSNLTEKLMRTENRPLCEGNDWGDRFWGACGVLLPDGNRGVLVGQNWLGRILMIVREELRS